VGLAGPGLGPLVDLADLLGELPVALLVEPADEALRVRARRPDRQRLLRTLVLSAHDASPTSRR
jgi:hypothetical protein